MPKELPEKNNPPLRQLIGKMVTFHHDSYKGYSRTGIIGSFNTKTQQYSIFWETDDVEIISKDDIPTNRFELVTLIKPMELIHNLNYEISDKRPEVKKTT